jgi:hypothetical protein
MKPHLPIGVSNEKAFILLVVCDENNEKCMKQECMMCIDKINGFDLSLQEGSAASDITTYHQWQTLEGRATKCQLNGTVDDVFKELRSQLKPFLLHTFLKRRQAEHFENLKASVDGSTAVLQVDYSENFSFGEQNEIQTAHWSNVQCTLFTGFAWLNKNVTRSYVLVSDHGKVSVYTYMKQYHRGFENTFSHM